MKNILIFGAAGRTGRIITQLAIEYGYYVTVMVRNPGKLNMADENLEILQGDVLKYHDVENAVRGHDAVISALGSNDSGDVAVYTIGTQNIIDAMEKQSVSRFIGMSSIGAGGTKSKMHFFVKVKATVMGLHKSLNAQTAQELLLHKSNLQFSLVQVAGFNKKKTCGLRGIKSHDPDDFKKRVLLPPGIISPKQAATFIIKELIKPCWVYQTVCLYK